MKRYKVNLLERSALRLHLTMRGIPFIETKGLWSSVFEIQASLAPTRKALLSQSVWYRRLHAWAFVKE